MKNEFANSAAAGRKALTPALRPKFSEVSELLAKMDRPGLRIVLVKSMDSGKPVANGLSRISHRRSG